MNGTSPDRNLAAYCGLYCGACDIHVLHRTAEAAGREAAWSELPPEFRDHLPFGPAPIRCEGCRGETVFVGCTRCPVRACARARRLEGSCASCDRYPCFRYAIMRLIFLLGSLERKLPHLRNRKAAREAMACAGVDRWLADQEARWRCPACGARTSWYARACQGCGKELSGVDRSAA